MLCTKVRLIVPIYFKLLLWFAVVIVLIVYLNIRVPLLIKIVNTGLHLCALFTKCYVIQFVKTKKEKREKEHIHFNHQIVAEKNKDMNILEDI